MAGAPPPAQPDRRIVERCPVDEAALVRTLVARNQPRPPGMPVTIVDVSLRGAGLRALDGVEFTPGHTIELGIDDDWSRCRIVWGGEGVDGSCVCGVRFVEEEPSFLHALLRWIEREADGPAR